MNEKSKETLVRFVKAARTYYNKGRLGAQGFMNCDLHLGLDACQYKYLKDKDYRCAVGAGLNEDELKSVMDLGYNVNGVRVLMDLESLDDYNVIDELERLQDAHDYWAESVKDNKVGNADIDEVKHQEEKFLAELKRLEVTYL